jgi:ABC-type branched-subunit amino acid transport system permease subunit
MTDASEAAFFHESVVNLNHIRALRSSRLDDASSGLLPFLWWVLVVGGVATVGFSFLFGAENFRAQAIMTMLITGVIFLAFYTIVNLDFPYSGVVAIPSTTFQELIFK